MRIIKSKDVEELGKEAAEEVAYLLNDAVQKNGRARLLLATGKSQLTIIDELVKKEVDWSKVEMFHLDEYVNLSENHQASFRNYLQERFVKYIDLKKVYFINGEGDTQETIQKLTKEVRKSPIDVALVGIGENAHIAFNDPPADFDTQEAFIKVKLDHTARNQQVREGWFASIDEVPEEAITMTAYEIMKSKKIISCVPFEVKAEAVKSVLKNEVNNKIPATILKRHTNWTLYLDEESASLINKDDLQQ